MTDDYDLTTKVEKEVLEWLIDNYNEIETVTPRMIVKITELRTSEPDRWKEMANIKFGV